MQNNRSKVFKSAGAQTIVTIVMGLLGILYFSIMSRLLDKEDFGYFAIITAVTVILSSLSEAGLGASIIQNKYANQGFISTAMTLSLLASLSFAGFLFATASLFSELLVNDNSLTLGFRIIALSFLFYSFNSIGKSVIIKKLNFLRFGVYDIIGYTLSSLVGITMACYGFGFYAAIIAVVLHQLFISIILLCTKSLKFSLRIERGYIKQIISYGGWLTGSILVRNINQQLDKLIVSHWLPVSVLGAYNRPAGFVSQITSQLNGVFDVVLFPILSGINDDKSKVASSYQRTVVIVLLYSTLLMFAFILSAGLIVSVFLGEKWLDLVDLFRIISLSIVLQGYSRVADCFFRSLCIVKAYFNTRLIVCMLTCVFVYIGCQYGLYGLAIGILLSFAMDCIVKVFFLRKYILIDRPQIYANIFKAVALPTVIAIALFFACTGGIINSIVLLTVYLIIIGLTAIFIPKALGRIYYEDLYIPLISKLKRHKDKA